MQKLLLVLRHSAMQLEKDSKYRGIIHAFEKQGFCVSYSVIDNGKVYLITKNERVVIGKYPSNRIGERIAANFIVYNSLNRYIKTHNLTYDISYVRMMPATGSFRKLIARIKEQTSRVILEIPSYPLVGEVNSDKRMIRRMLHTYFYENERRISKSVDLYTIIGDPCEEYNNVKAINISNGIEIDEIPLRKIEKKNSTINVLALGKMARWHGYDRLIVGLNNYLKQNPNRNIIVNVVGSDGDGSIACWKDLVHEYNLEDYVMFHGPLYGKQLDDMFNKCDVAIASLGMHRKGAHFTSELKIREYCARGIPFIYSAEDRDLSNTLDFCKKVPLDDSPIDISVIVDLYEKYNNKPEAALEIRSFCEMKMSWDNQIQRIIKAIDTV